MNSTFPKELSKKIIHQFLGDYDELLPEHPFKELCNRTINKIFNLTSITNTHYENERNQNLNQIWKIIDELNNMSNFLSIDGKGKKWNIYLHFYSTITEIRVILNLFFVELKLIKTKYRQKEIEISFEVNDRHIEMFLNH